MHKRIVSATVGVMTIVFALLSVAPLQAVGVIETLEETAEIEVGAQTMAFDPPYLYLLTEAGVEVFDLSDPEAPDEIGSYAVSGLVDFALQGDRLYAVDAQNAYVMDISSPISPTLVAQFDLEGADAVAVEKDWLYVLVTDGVNGGYGCELRAYDVSNPAQVERGDTLAIAGDRCPSYPSPTSLFVRNQVAYFRTVSGITHGGCCYHVWVADIDEGEFTQRQPIDVSVPLQMEIAPAGNGTLYMTLGANGPCVDGASGIRSVRYVDDLPVLTPLRHELLCGALYSALSVAGNRLYATYYTDYAGVVWASRLDVYERTAAQNERFLTSYQFPGSGYQIRATATLVLVLGDDQVRILRWVETPVVERGFLPAVGHGAVARN